MRLKVSGGSALASIDLPKDAVKCPLQSPLSDALSSISLVHPLSLLIETSWPLIYHLFYALCLHKTLFNYTLFTLMSSFQTRRLSAVRMAEDNLEMGKGSAVGQIWDFDQNWSDRDWSRLIRLWEAKNRQWICENWRENWKREKLVSICLLKAKSICFDQTSLVCVCCMRFCLLVQFVHLRPWELQGWGGKQVQAVGAFARKKTHLSPR